MRKKLNEEKTYWISETKAIMLPKEGNTVESVTKRGWCLYEGKDSPMEVIKFLTADEAYFTVLTDSKQEFYDYFVSSINNDSFKEAKTSFLNNDSDQLLTTHLEDFFESFEEYQSFVDDMSQTYLNNLMVEHEYLMNFTKKFGYTSDNAKEIATGICSEIDDIKHITTLTVSIENQENIKTYCEIDLVTGLIDVFPENFTDDMIDGALFDYVRIKFLNIEYSLVDGSISEDSLVDMRNNQIEYQVRQRNEANEIPF